MGSKFSKSSKDKDEKKWNDFKAKAKLPERLDKYSTLPASFRRRAAEPKRDEEKTGTLPRNLNRNESFSKRFRKSIKSWASQKGLAEVSRAGRTEIEPKSEESTKPSSVILDIEKVADVGQLEEELKKSDSSSQQTEVVVEVASPREVNDSKDEIKQIENDSKLEIINDSSLSQDIIVVEPVDPDDKPAHIPEVSEHLPVLESSAENKDEILQTALEDQSIEIPQEMEKKATELSEEIMNEVETILTQKQELASESKQPTAEENESFEIVEEQEIQELRTEENIEDVQGEAVTNTEETVEKSQEEPESPMDTKEELLEDQTFEGKTKEENCSVPVEEDLTKEDEVLTEQVVDTTEGEEKMETEAVIESKTDSNPEMRTDSQETGGKVELEETDSHDKSVSVEESFDEAETEKSSPADNLEVGVIEDSLKLEETPSKVDEDQSIQIESVETVEAAEVIEKPESVKSEVGELPDKTLIKEVSEEAENDIIECSHNLQEKEIVEDTQCTQESLEKHDAFEAEIEVLPNVNEVEKESTETEEDKIETQETVESEIVSGSDGLLGETEKEIDEVVVCSKSQPEETDEVKEDLLDVSTVSEEIQEKLQESEIEENPIEKQETVEEQIEQIPDVSIGENEKEEVVETEKEKEDLSDVPTVPSDRVGDLGENEKELVEVEEIAETSDPDNHENVECAESGDEEKEEERIENVDEEPEKTISENGLDEEIVEGSKSQVADKDASLDLSDPIWKHQWSLDCLAGDEGKRGTIREIISDIVGVATDMANIPNNEGSLEVKENVAELVEEIQSVELSSTQDQNKDDVLLETSETEDIQSPNVDNESQDLNTIEDEKEKDDVVETSENVDIPNTNADEIIDDGNENQDLNKHEDEKKEVDVVEASKNVDIQSPSVDEIVDENQDTESTKDEAKVGIFITEDIDEIIESVEDMTDGVKDEICEETVSGADELTESKDKPDVETVKAADNEISKEETDHQNETSSQIQEDKSSIE